MSNQQVSQAEDWGHLPGERGEGSLFIQTADRSVADTRSAERTPPHLRPWFRGVLR